MLLIAAQLLGPVLQSSNQLLCTGRILQAKNQIGLCDEGVGAPGEIEISTLREGTKDLVALVNTGRDPVRKAPDLQPDSPKQTNSDPTTQRLQVCTGLERQRALHRNNIDRICPAAPRRVGNQRSLLVLVKAKAPFKQAITL